MFKSPPPPLKSSTPIPDTPQSPPPSPETQAFERTLCDLDTNTWCKTENFDQLLNHLARFFCGKVPSYSLLICLGLSVPQADTWRVETQLEPVAETRLKKGLRQAAELQVREDDFVRLLRDAAFDFEIGHGFLRFVKICPHAEAFQGLEAPVGWVAKQAHNSQRSVCLAIARKFGYYEFFRKCLEVYLKTYSPEWAFSERGIVDRPVVALYEVLDKGYWANTSQRFWERVNTAVHAAGLWHSYYSWVVENGFQGIVFGATNEVDVSNAERCGALDPTDAV